MLKKYKLRSYNFILVFILIVTSVFALAVVNSANSAYTVKQGAGIAISFIIMIIVSFIDYNWILKYYWIWYAIVTIMLIGVLTVFGHGSHGATRWFKIGPVQLQPSEFLKLALILLVAKLVAANKEKLNSIKFLLLIACLTLFPILLVALQPNLSTAILLTLIVIAMLYCSGVSYKIFGIAILVAMVVLVCFLQDGERRIPVQYSQKVSGRRTVGGQSTNIPLKVNTAGVMPIIFASSLMQFPVIIAQLFGKSYEWTRYLSSSYWCRVEAPKYSIGLLVYIVLLIIFAYFYTSITFNPIEVADNLKKAGGVIPGITPGKSTSEYLNKILNYIVFIGAVGLLIIALIPIMCTGFFNASVSFGGTSIIIIVGVVLETLKQIESQMCNRYYKGFLSE